MIVVHHLNNSRSQRVLWLLEELGVAYKVVRYTRDPATRRAPNALREVHPLGKAPVVVDDGIVVAESGTIIEFLLERYGKGLLSPAPDTPERLQYLYWMHYAEGSAMPNLLLKLVFDQIEAGPVPFYVRPVVRGLARAVKTGFVAPQLALHLDFIEAELAKSEWFAGEQFTAADIQMSFPLQAAAGQGLVGDRLPGLSDFLRRIEARPAWGRSVERGGPFNLTD